MEPLALVRNDQITNNTKNTQTIKEPTPNPHYNIEFSDTEKTDYNKKYQYRYQPKQDGYYSQQ